MNKRSIFCGSLAVALFLAPGTSHARWMNPNTGRFHTMDSYDGDQEAPITLHKYIYCGNNPVNMVDPSGEDFELTGLSDGISGLANIASFASPIAAQIQQRARQLGRPSSTRFWEAYKKVNYDTFPPEKNVEVWKKVGGNIGKRFGPIAENSCATRVSWGLNYGGAPIPGGTPGVWHNFPDQSYNNKKGDDKFYLVNAGLMNGYLASTWGPPDYTPTTVPQLNSITSGLREGQCAVFATKLSPGHSGVLKKGYHDPYVEGELPLDVWKLLFP